MTCNLEKKQLIETGLQMTHMLELADKDFKTGVINVLKKMNQGIENFEQRKEKF